MDLPAIKVQKRELFGSRASRRLRADGLVPINLFGLGRPSIAFAAQVDDIDEIVKRGSHLIEIDLDGEHQQAFEHGRSLAPVTEHRPSEEYEVEDVETTGTVEKGSKGLKEPHVVTGSRQECHVVVEGVVDRDAGIVGE